MKSAHALEQDRPDVLKRRRAWFDEQLHLDPQKLVFIDETGLSTKMARLRGLAIRGERCRAGVPHGHWKTNDIHRCSTPDRNDRTVCLRRTNERQRLPGLRRAGVAADSPTRGYCRHGQFARHKAVGVRDAIECMGAKLMFLPPTAPTSPPSKTPSQS